MLINAERAISIDDRRQSLTLIESSSSSSNDDQFKEIQFTNEYNTIGKQIVKFESFNKENNLFEFLNHLWGKQIFTNDYINKIFNLLLLKD